ncbi:MAG: hypothetical protein AABX48_01910 [Nanoarchaeota archaeon]
MNHKEKNNHSNHMWLMVLACVGAFLLILVLPLLGLSKNWSVGIAIVVMIGLHLWMMRGHFNHDHFDKKEEKLK